MSDIVLQFENVAASYNGAIAALHGISLTLRAGEFAALLGANGAGKTTLLKAASNVNGRVKVSQMAAQNVATLGLARSPG